MHLNSPQLVHKHPAHVVSPVKMELEKVRHSRTTPNSCQRTLHALLSLRLCGSRKFEEVRCARTSAGETRCAGCLCTSTGLFKRIEPP